MTLSKNITKGALVYAKSFSFILFIGVLVHLAFIFSGHLAVDDFLQRYVFLDNARLSALGLIHSYKGFWFTLSHQFDFFNSSEPLFHSLKAYGVIPWWINEDAKLHLFRPLSSFTHWLDYQLWPNNISAMHATSLLLLAFAWLAVFKCYQSIEKKQKIALLAALLLVLDVSIIFPLVWLAARNVILVMLMTGLSLFFLHKSQHQKSYYFLSLFFFFASLLSAEAGVTTFGFILSYLLFLDKTPYRLSKGFGFLATIAAWKLCYNLAGFGSTDVGNYIDPLHFPLEFISRCLSQYPSLILSGITGIDVLPQNIQTSFAGISAGFILLVILVKTQRPQLKFWISAFLFSLIPYMALPYTAPRFTVLSHIAFAGILANLLFIPIKQFPKPVRFSFKTLLLLLLVTHSLLAFLVTSIGGLTLTSKGSLKAKNVNHQYHLPQIEDLEKKHAVILQSIDPFQMMFQAYKSTTLNNPTPQSIQQIAPATTSLEVNILNPKLIEVSFPEGLILTGKEIESVLTKEKAHIERNFEFYGFFYQGNYIEVAGNLYNLKAFKLEILSTNKQNHVTAIRLHLAFPYDSTHYAWLIWDSQNKRYMPFRWPNNTQHLELPGLIEKASPSKELR